jgi:aminoglycoside phosphotransferase (APT) family kinase protein
MLAVGGTYQELTGATALMAANRVFRIWRKGRSFVLKVYGSEARQRREGHALHALGDLPHLPRVLDRGVHDEAHWITFEDAGRWNLQSLPENPGLARSAGAILAEVHAADRTPFSNLARGIDGEWVAVDFGSAIKRLDRYRSRVGVSQGQIEMASRVNPPFASDPVVAHTDPVMRNFIVDDAGHLTLIDWGWATLAPPEWDLTRMLWSATMHAGPGAAEAVVEGYGRDMDQVQLDRWIVYHAAQTLVTYAERNVSIRPGDVPDSLAAEFDRAVLGAVGG